MNGDDEGDATKVIAFYLPQFSPVAENDAWWGAGFTDWVNAARAEPLFEGHEQPHLPGELGFYDLRVPEVRERQASLARDHGIDGFMYYHYWFGGRRVLDRTFDEVLRTGRPDFPFCLCWANENWTRAWDASENEILLEQRYDADERAAHIAWLVDAFSDDRYIRIAGRPLFAIYRIQALPEPDSFVVDLRQAAANAGLPDPHIVKFDTHGTFDDPATLGCDAAAQFLPHGVREHVPAVARPDGVDDTDHVYVSYDDVVDAYIDLPAPQWTRHECVFPSWDNTARRRDHGALVIHGSTPDRYEHWLRAVHDRAPDRGGVVFVNAWNEWAEGAHLEPDDRWGRSYLEATARVTRGGAPTPTIHADDDDPLLGPSYAELYFDMYERYVHAQRRLTVFDAVLRREVDRRTAELADLLEVERQRADQLAGELDAVIRRDR